MSRVEAGELLDQGLIEQDAGRWDAAPSLYERAAEADPTLAAAWYNAGLIHKWRRDWKPALACFRRALLTGRFEDAASLAWNLGITATALASWTDAFRAWKELEIPVTPGDDGTPQLAVGLTPIRLLDPHVLTRRYRAVAVDSDGVTLELAAGGDIKIPWELAEWGVAHSHDLELLWLHAPSGAAHRLALPRVVGGEALVATFIGHLPERIRILLTDLRGGEQARRALGELGVEAWMLDAIPRGAIDRVRIARARQQADRTDITVWLETGGTAVSVELVDTGSSIEAQMTGAGGK